MWKSSSELLKDIREAHEALCRGETDAETAHAKARILGMAAKVLGLQLDHARATNRLTSGSDELPAFRVGGEEKKR